MTSSAAPAGPLMAVVVAHADLAAGLVSAVEQITGRGAQFLALSNRGLSPTDLEAELVRLVVAGARIVFTDLPAGSTTLAARRVQKAHPELVVATGVNLATLLDFAFAAGDVVVASAARTAVEKGRAALQLPTAPTAGPGAPRAD